MVFKYSFRNSVQRIFIRMITSRPSPSTSGSTRRRWREGRGWIRGWRIRSQILTCSITPLIYRRLSGFFLFIRIFLWPESDFNKFEPSLQQKRVSIERWLKSWNIKYSFKWNQSYLSRGSNSLNSAFGGPNLMNLS